MAAKQRQVVENHFRVASAGWEARYEARPRRMSDLDLQLRRENVHRLLRPLLAPSRPLRVLDVGCGTGGVLDGVSRNLVSVVGVDVVSQMVATAARRQPGDRFTVADAAQLPFRPEAFDMVTCLGVLEYLSSPGLVLQGIRERLRPGGRMIVSVPNRASVLRKLSLLEERVEGGLSAVWRALRGRPGEHDQGPRCRHTQWTPDGALRLVREAGFEVEDVLFNTYGLWGRVGHWQASLDLSIWMTRRFSRRGAVSSLLASTMVVLARRTTNGQR